MIDVGTIITLGGKEGIVCFRAEYNEKYYINVNFEVDGKDEFNVYEVKVDDEHGEYVFRKVKDKEIIDELSSRWVVAGLLDEEK